ncbi:hypothetical protein M3M33_17225, partial [Loigolactobacillus coryniformis]|uniref:hypothetical protein n=1 Tax=Loigolactobacillus coryniformis TaxID=1610 RepID=UPI00201B1081
TGGGSAVISGTLKVLDLMEAQGIDTTNPAAIKAARNDPAIWGPIAQQASLYGIGVGLFDAASAGAASKLSRMARGAT